MTQTPAQRKGYKVGDQFVVVEGGTFDEGSIVTLARDDGSDNPLFTGEGTAYMCGPGGTKGAFTSLWRLAPLKPTSDIAVMRDRLEDIQKEMAALVAEDKELRERLRAERLELVEAPKVVEPLHQSEWREGDIVRCVQDDPGCAVLTIGKDYTIGTRGQGQYLSITDDDGDKMLGCLDEGCFVFVRRP